ncbi:unnamed protein product [Lampetra fluviatilis]
MDHPPGPHAGAVRDAAAKSTARERASRPERARLCATGRRVRLEEPWTEPPPLAVAAGTPLAVVAGTPLVSRPPRRGLTPALYTAQTPAAWAPA